MGGVLKISAVRLYPKLLEEAPPGFEIHEVMAHGLKKTLQFVSFLQFGKLALQSQIVRNHNLVLFILNYFDGIYHR
jgi:hypothetical protein